MRGLPPLAPLLDDGQEIEAAQVSFFNVSANGFVGWKLLHQPTARKKEGEREREGTWPIISQDQLLTITSSRKRNKTKKKRKTRREREREREREIERERESEAMLFDSVSVSSVTGRSRYRAFIIECSTLIDSNLVWLRKWSTVCTAVRGSLWWIL